MKRVEWSYRHYLNSKAFFWALKRGEYFGKVKHTIKYNGPQLSVVQFDGNKKYSRVPFCDLVFID